MASTAAARLSNAARDADLVGGHVEEQGEVGDDVLAEELVLCHGGQREGDDDQRGRDDVYRGRSAHYEVEKAGVTVEVVDPCLGRGYVWDVLAGGCRGRQDDATGRVSRAVDR